MSTKEKEKEIAGSAVAAAETTTTIHTEAAQALLQELRLMRDLIPRLIIPVSRKERTRLSPAASVPPEFVELTAVATANEKVLVREGAAPAETRDLMNYADAYSPVADELEALAQFVRHSVTAPATRPAARR